MQTQIFGVLQFLNFFKATAEICCNLNCASGAFSAQLDNYGCFESLQLKRVESSKVKGGRKWPDPLNSSQFGLLGLTDWSQSENSLCNFLYFFQFQHSVLFQLYLQASESNECTVLYVIID